MGLYNRIIIMVALCMSVTAQARTFDVVGVINEDIRPLVAEIMAEIDNDPDEIVIILDSPGGRVDIGMELVEAIHLAQYNLIPVVCHVPHRGVASMAWIILTQCDERHVYSGAKLMMHDIAAVVPGMFGCVINRQFSCKLCAELERAQQKLEKLIHDTFDPADNVYRYLNDNQVFFNAAQANSYVPGFVDEILTEQRTMPSWNRR